MSPLLTRVIDLIAHLRTQGSTNAQIGSIVAQIINSPLLAAAVASTPTPLDDLILGALKVLFPLPKSGAFVQA